MTDKEINTEGGTFVGKDVETGGGHFTGRDSEKNRQSMTAFVGSSEGMQNQQLWWEFMKLAQQVMDLRRGQDEVSQRITRLEIVINPNLGEIRIHPLEERTVFSTKFVMTFAVVVGGLVLMTMIALLYVQLH